MNLKTLIISTSLSVFFGIYSIYGLMLYLEKLDELEKSETYYKREIDSLKTAIRDIDKKYDETNEKYNDLFITFQKIKTDIDILSNNITNLETNKMELINCISSPIPIYDSSLEDIMEDAIDHNKILCNAKINIPKLNFDVIKVTHNNEELKDNTDISLSLTKNVHLEDTNKESNFEEHEFEILEQGSEHIIRSRARGTSVSDINWAAVTKKFIFG